MEQDNAVTKPGQDLDLQQLVKENLTSNTLALISQGKIAKERLDRINPAIALLEEEITKPEFIVDLNEAQKIHLFRLLHESSNDIFNMAQKLQVMASDIDNKNVLHKFINDVKRSLNEEDLLETEETPLEIDKVRKQRLIGKLKEKLATSGAIK